MLYKILSFISLTVLLYGCSNNKFKEYKVSINDFSIPYDSLIAPKVHIFKEKRNIHPLPDIASFKRVTEDKKYASFYKLLSNNINSLAKDSEVYRITPDSLIIQKSYTRIVDTTSSNGYKLIEVEKKEPIRNYLHLTSVIKLTTKEKEAKRELSIQLAEVKKYAFNGKEYDCYVYIGEIHNEYKNFVNKEKNKEVTYPSEQWICKGLGLVHYNTYDEKGFEHIWNLSEIIPAQEYFNRAK